MADKRTLHARIVPPREKHPTIVQVFAALAPGESFVLVNDYEPKPRRYQFEFEREDELAGTTSSRNRVLGVLRSPERRREGLAHTRDGGVSGRRESVTASGAGKAQSSRLLSPRGMNEYDVASLADLAEGEARAFNVTDAVVVLCPHEGELCALDGLCTHEDLPLDCGAAEEGVLKCPWHGARYDVTTGRVLALLAARPLRVNRSRVDNSGRIVVEIDV